jgi:hypothetical protein
LERRKLTMRLVAVLGMGLLSVPCLLAQNTWRGLRFGTNEAEVRKAYQGTLKADQEKSNKYGRFILSDEDQTLASQPATADLFFDESGKLNEVELMLREPLGSGTGESFAVIGFIDRELTEKYGKPTTQKGECGLTIDDVVANRPQKIFVCEKMWRSEGQTIGLYWSIQDKRLKSCFLNYKPLPSDI